MPAASPRPLARDIALGVAALIGIGAAFAASPALASTGQVDLTRTPVEVAEKNLQMNPQWSNPGPLLFLWASVDADPRIDYTLPGATVGAVYLDELSPDYVSTVEWHVNPATPLPAGLALAADGTISGTPTAAFDGTFEAAAVAGGDVADAAVFRFQIMVADATAPASGTPSSPVPSGPATQPASGAPTPPTPAPAPASASGRTARPRAASATAAAPVPSSDPAVASAPLTSAAEPAAALADTGTDASPGLLLGLGALVGGVVLTGVGLRRRARRG